jgi:arsenate reductase
MSSDETLLFLCVANSARSQMAEGLARKLFGSRVARAERGQRAVDGEPVRDRGDARGRRRPDGAPSKSVQTIDAATVGTVITLCAEEVCPVFLGKARRHWPIQDPASKDSSIPRARCWRGFAARDQIQARLEVLAALLDLPEGPQAQEFHASVRVKDLATSTRFYAWLLGAEPKEWTHRYSTSSGRSCARTSCSSSPTARSCTTTRSITSGSPSPTGPPSFARSSSRGTPGLKVNKPPRTTWRGTPLHELWLEDPDGNLVEIYARLTPEELAQKPEDLEPTALA